MEQELLQRIENLEQMVESLKDELSNSGEKFDVLEEEYLNHNHSSRKGNDSQLQSDIFLPKNKFINVGNTFRGEANLDLSGNVQLNNMIIGSGPIVGNSVVGGGVSGSSGNTQLVIQHQPSDYTDWSFFYANRPPIYTFTVYGISGDTITTDEVRFAENELVGLSVQISSSSGVEYAKVLWNTTSVITLDRSFTRGEASIFVSGSVFLGSADFPWKRLYVAQDTSGGVRFGFGATGQGDNGLLYMNDGGNLIWRDKGGSTTTIA